MCLSFQVLLTADRIITVLFTIEMCIKVVACGLVLHPGSYLRNAWNVLDAFIVVVSIANLALGNLEFFKGARADVTLSCEKLCHSLSLRGERSGVIQQTCVQYSLHALT